MPILLLLFALAAEPRGVLCIDGHCAPAAAMSAQVEATDAPRPFVWTSSDGSRAVAGMIAAGQSRIELPEDEPRNGATPRGGTPRLRFAIRTSDGARQLPLSIELRGATSALRWEVAQVPAKTLEILSPPCECTLVIRARDYRTLDKPLRAERPALGELLVLERLPVLSGSIRDAATGVPLAGARLLLRNGETLATAGEDGRFRVAVDGPWPASIEVGHPGLASRIVEVPRAAADTELPPIALTRGGSIRASVAPLRPAEEKLRWELRRETRLSGQEVLRRGELTADAPSIAIDAIDAGTYRLVLRGDGPLQQHAVAVDVEEGRETNAAIRLEPALVELEVRHGGEPLGGAKVELEHLASRWRGAITVDEKGRATEEIWQQGDFELVIGRAPQVTAWIGERAIRGDGRLRVLVDVPKRTIAGRVLDAATSAPIEGAVVSLETLSARGKTLLTATTGADGSFSFAGVPAGQQTVSARRKGYRGGNGISFTLNEDDGDWRRDLLLERLLGRTAIVVNGQGLPIGGASVLLMTAQGVRDAGRTDADGRVMLPLASENERGVVFAVPRSGSFGFARLSGGIDQPFTVRVADGTATLEVLARSSGGAPIPRVGVAMRVDGMIVPREVMDALSAVQGIALLTDGGGRLVYPGLPPGRYELWPVLSREDLLKIYSPLAPPPAADVTLVAGTQSAVMTFTRP